MTAMQEIVARASNRVFVGLPVCSYICSKAAFLVRADHPRSSGRNEHFLKLGIKFAIDVIKDKDYLRHYPKFLKGYVGDAARSIRFCLTAHSIVARYTSDSVKTVWSAADHLKPLVEERRRKAEEYGGEWPGKPVSTGIHAEIHL